MKVLYYLEDVVSGLKQSIKERDENKLSVKQEDMGEQVALNAYSSGYKTYFENEFKEFVEDENPENENDKTEEEINMTFFNPSSGLNCGDCDFVAKNGNDLKNHRRAKHKT